MSPRKKKIIKKKYVPRLKEHYKKKIVPKLIKQFGYKNPMAAPKLVKIVLNSGVKEAVKNPKITDFVVKDMTIISGQHPVIRKAKRPISNFKLRKGMPIGCMVTLRGDRMYEFFDRLFNVAVPRIRDFRGLNPNSFDGRGNYTFGISEQLIFPEIEYDKVKHTFGMDITIVTTSASDEEARTLLLEMGVPFKEK